MIGILHPGDMGASIGRELRNLGHRVVWCSVDRSVATRDRASRAGLEEARSLEDLYVSTEVILSICPSEVATDVAKAVAESPFRGTFVEANAISPLRMVGIGEQFCPERVSVLDGALIGLPPKEKTRTRLYLSGDTTVSDCVVELFKGSHVEVVVTGGSIGSVSALKMAHSAYRKTTWALAVQSMALAASYGMNDHLLEEARRLDGTAIGHPELIPRIARKAWRWSPELREVMESMRSEGLSGDLYLAAMSIYERWMHHKDDPEVGLHVLLEELVKLKG